jgi:hypothetical protein
MLKWKDLFTERDGQTPCFVRLLTFAGIAFLLVLTGREFARGGSVDLVQFATAFTMIVAGGAAGARVKLDTEASAS